MSVSTFIKQILTNNSTLSSIIFGEEKNKIENFNKIHPINGELFYNTIFTTKNSYYIFNNITLSKENGTKHFIGVMDPENKTMMDYYYFKDGEDYYVTASVDFKIIYREINPNIEDIKSMVRNLERYVSKLNCGTMIIHENDI